MHRPGKNWGRAVDLSQTTHGAYIVARIARRAVRRLWLSVHTKTKKKNVIDVPWKSESGASEATCSACLRTMTILAKQTQQLASHVSTPTSAVRNAPYQYCTTPLGTLTVRSHENSDSLRPSAKIQVKIPCGRHLARSALKDR